MIASWIRFKIFLFDIPRKDSIRPRVEFSTMAKEEISDLSIWDAQRIITVPSAPFKGRRRANCVQTTCSLWPFSLGSWGSHKADLLLPDVCGHVLAVRLFKTYHDSVPATPKSTAYFRTTNASLLYCFRSQTNKPRRFSGLFYGRSFK